MGADPVVLRNLADILELFEEDESTDAVIVVGEVGGEQEEKAAGFISRRMTKPVAAYIAGRHSHRVKEWVMPGLLCAALQGPWEVNKKHYVKRVWKSLKALYTWRRGRKNTNSNRVILPRVADYALCAVDA